MKNLLCLLLIPVLICGMFAGCAGGSTPSSNTPSTADAAPAANNSSGSSAAAEASGSNEPVKITLLNSKGGIMTDPLKNMAAQYAEQTGVEIEIITIPDSDSPFERISTMYSSGNPPTIAMLDPTDILAIGGDKAVDLSSEKWLEETGTLAASIDGIVYGFPFCVEGKGLIYNKTAIENASGETFDPASLKNLNDLEGLFKKMQAGGMEGPMLIIKEDWSLAAHFLQLVYESQGNGTKADIDNFFEQLKSGNVKLMENDRFNQYMDSFDVFNTYNYKRVVEKDPISGDYMQDVLTFSEGNAGIYFNGNWSWGAIAEFSSHSDFGMMPVYTNADNNDFTNTALECWASKYLMIDREKSTPEQQQAAKDFISWLVYDEKGQSFLVNDVNLIPAAKNNALALTDPLSISVKKYVESGNVFAAAIVPGDHWSVVGASMQKYLAGVIDRATLAGDIEKYWLEQASK